MASFITILTGPADTGNSIKPSARCSGCYVRINEHDQNDAPSQSHVIGCLVLTNSLSGANDPAGLAGDILHALIHEQLVEKSQSFDIPPALEESAPYEAPDPNNFTPYEPAWKKYIGGYRLIHGGYEPRIYAKIALALGYRHPAIRVDVFEKDGYLCVGAGDMGGGRLDEHLPGLLFNEAGDCLDLRGPEPRWRNVRMKKVK